MINTRVLPESTAPDRTFKYIDISQVDSNGTLSLPDEDVSFGEAPSRARRFASAGDTIVSTVRTYLTAIARVPATAAPLVFSTGFAVLEPKGIESRFLTYACRSRPFVGEVVARSTGVSYPAINPSDLASISIPMPEPQEQRRIADFLDDRITRIDQIIAARQRQLELLPSLIEAEIAEVIDEVGGAECPLWMVTEKITDGAHVSPDTTDGVFDFVSTRDIGPTGSIDFEGSLKTSSRSYAELVKYGCRPQVGDVLFSKDGTVGRTARVTEDREFVVASSLIIIRPVPSLLNENYLHFLCKHAKFTQQVDAFVKGAGLPRISIANLRRVTGIFPPLKSQLSLALQLGTAYSSAVRTGEHLMASVDRLTEFKQSLITAAVTGELDVTTASSGIPG